MEQFDLPPEEWRWQKDGPADRGGSTLSAAAAQCHIQTDPSSGSRLLYLHATAGETTGARTQEPKIKKTAVRSLLFFHVEAEIWSWTDNSFLRGLVCMCEETSWTQITFNISFPTACRRCFSSPGVYCSSRALCHFNVCYVTLSALSEVWLKHLWHTIKNGGLCVNAQLECGLFLVSRFFGPVCVIYNAISNSRAV